MKLFALSLFSLVCAFAPALAGAPAASDRVVLDANTLANLRLESAPAEPRDFEETVFALGRVEIAHGAIATVSSRIPGRVAELIAHIGDTVEAGQIVARIESRAAGDPAPLIPLRAPRGGVVTDCEIHVGDPVEPDRHLMEISDLSVVEAVARVPEAEVGALRVGETEARVRLAAFPGETFAGRLARFAPAADPATGTLAAHFVLPNPEGRLRAGLRAEFAIVTARRADVLAVPRAAVQGEGVGPRFVFVRDAELPNAFVKTPVVLGATNDRHVEIVSGLSTGAEVVTRGAYSLAFAGTGSLSLKEALDAAHGHEHAADGSELKPGAGHDHGDAHGHDHGPAGGHDDHAHGHAHPERPWQIAAGLLALSNAALIIALARRRHA